MESKHTKGTWSYTSDGEANFSGIATKENWLMRIQHNGELLLEEQDANTKLIAAAPELLEALQKIHNMCYGDVKGSLDENLDKIADVTLSALQKIR